MKKLFTRSLALVLVLSTMPVFSSCGKNDSKETTVSETTVETTILDYSDLIEEDTTTNPEDRLQDSYGQINQDIKRPADWKQIVSNSPFRLGEKNFVSDYYGRRIEISYGTYPHIDGSTTCVPMAIEFARQHLALSDEDAAFFTDFNTTSAAYENLIGKLVDHYESSYIYSQNISMRNKVVDIIIATEPSDEHIELARSLNIDLIYEPVCYDSFVFITHKDNPVDSLTVEQIQKIYTGEITNWKELGGNDEAIVAYQRTENSGSQTTMEKRVMQGKEMMEPKTSSVIADMGELIDVVSEYENSRASIGYTFKFYIDTLYKSEKIKILKINGVEPNNANMQNKTYAFTTNYYGVIRAESKDKIGGKFLEWMLSDEGQQCILQAGYCPMR